MGAGLTRGAVTWLLYAVFACMSFLLNGLGGVLAPLQRELGVSRADVAFYPSFFAAGLVVVGLAGGAFVHRIGRRAMLRLSIGGMLMGGLLFAVPGHVPTLAGALLLGLGAALLIQLIPALLAGLHPHASTAAVGEANGFASAASVLAPLAVGATISAGLGWRAGYLAVPLLALAAASLPIWRMAVPPIPEPSQSNPARAASLFGRWFDLFVAVSIEFCVVFWAASAFIDWHHASLGVAPVLASLFLVGMATARFMSAPITSRLSGPRALMLTSVGVAAGGFLLFWLAPPPALSAAGLLVTGLGVALLYPTTVSRLVAAWPHAPDRAAAVAALGSGLAIGSAPFVLGRLSDATNLRTAYLIVPALLIVLAVRGAMAPRTF
jgi:MFS family permease